jgi:hypothetical protein
MKIQIATALFVLAHAEPAFSREQTSLGNLRVSGDGCRPGSTSAALYDVDSDGLADEFQVIFSDFVAEQGPGISQGHRVSKCMITAQLGVSRRYQFSIQEVQFIGYADLPDRVQGVQESTYQFPSILGQRAFRTELTGPYSDEFLRTDTIVANGSLWSKCGTGIPFFIRAEMRLTGNSVTPAFMAGDQVNGLLTHRYKLQWRPCQ